MSGEKEMIGAQDRDGKREGEKRERGVKTLCEVLHPSSLFLAFPPVL